MMYESNSTNSGNLARIYIRDGNDETVIEANELAVERMFGSFLDAKYGGNRQTVSKIEGGIALLPPNTIAAEINTPSSANEGASRNETLEKTSENSEDLLEFYLRKQPKSQYEQLMVVARHFNRPFTPDECRQAYEDVLADIPVQMPANITARLNELVEKGYLRKHKDKDGKYGLTIAGKNAVEALPSK